MNARISVAVISFWLAVAGLIAGCSKKEEAPASAPNDSAAQERESSSTSTDSDDEELGTGDAVALAETFAKECDTDVSTRNCQILRSLLVVEVTMALEDLERSRDQRASVEALAALDITDEPAILIAACRVLGQFPDTPEIAEKLTPLVLASPYVEVQQAAANLLARNSDQATADIGRLWTQNHSELSARNEFEEYPDFPAHYRAMKFPGYPGAEWFSPADSQQSVGWSTPDDAATVAGWIGKQLDAEPLTAQQWYERSSAPLTQALKSMDQTKVDRIAQLSEQYGKTLDPKLIEQAEKLQKELYAPTQAAQAIADKSMDKVAFPGTSSPPEDVHYFVVEDKAGHVARAMLVYRLPGIDRTIVQTSWNLGDYPSAWPEDGTAL